MSLLKLCTVLCHSVYHQPECEYEYQSEYECQCCLFAANTCTRVTAPFWRRGKLMRWLLTAAWRPSILRPTTWLFMPSGCNTILWRIVSRTQARNTPSYLPCVALQPTNCCIFFFGVTDDWKWRGMMKCEILTLLVIPRMSNPIMSNTFAINLKMSNTLIN